MSLCTKCTSSKTSRNSQDPVQSHFSISNPSYVDIAAPLTPESPCLFARLQLCLLNLKNPSSLSNTTFNGRPPLGRCLFRQHTPRRRPSSNKPRVGCRYSPCSSDLSAEPLPGRLHYSLRRPGLLTPQARACQYESVLHPLRALAQDRCVELSYQRLAQ